jgi:hypothetical protein
MSVRQRLSRILFGVILLAIIAFAIHLALFEGWRDLTFGRFHRKANEAFSRVEGISEVRIYLLAEGENLGMGETFPIRPYDRSDPVSQKVTLKGKELQAFLKVWQFQEVSYLRQAMCHGPTYGFRLYRGKRLSFETSMCWSCNNFYVEVWPFGSSWYGFNAETEQAKELLAFCDKQFQGQRQATQGTNVTREKAAIPKQGTNTF